MNNAEKAERNRGRDARYEIWDILPIPVCGAVAKEAYPKASPLGEVPPQGAEWCEEVQQ
jgi:hypothetical protein